MEVLGQDPGGRVDRKRCEIFYLEMFLFDIEKLKRRRFTLKVTWPLAQR